MKKVFFTAIAIIAFSSISIANTISDENEIIVTPSLIFKNNIKNNSNNKIIKGMTWCEMIGTMVAHDVFMSTGDTGAATRAGRAAQISCMLGL